MGLATAEIDDLKTIKGVEFPASVHFRQILVTGPPGSGKTTLVGKLGGWPQEGFLDLGEKRWWQSSALTYRPREVHIGIPFTGHRESLAVFDDEWLSSRAPVDFERIRLPSPERRFWRIDWRARFAFDFQLLPPERLLAVRTERAKKGLHPVDQNVSLEIVEAQVGVYEELSRHFDTNGFVVYVRQEFGGRPRRISR